MSPTEERVYRLEQALIQLVLEFRGVLTRDRFENVLAWLNDEDYAIVDGARVPREAPVEPAPAPVTPAPKLPKAVPSGR